VQRVDALDAARPVGPADRRSDQRARTPTTHRTASAEPRDDAAALVAAAVGWSR